MRDSTYKRFITYQTIIYFCPFDWANYCEFQNTSQMCDSGISRYHFCVYRMINIFFYTFIYLSFKQVHLH